MTELEEMGGQSRWLKTGESSSCVKEWFLTAKSCLPESFNFIALPHTSISFDSQLQESHRSGYRPSIGWEGLGYSFLCY